MKAVVLVTRGLQAAYLGCYGNAWIDTPALDALAAEGVVFDQHFADAADPEGARRAWRTGHLDISGQPRVPIAPDLLDVLRERSVFMSLIVDRSRPAPAEFETGWDDVAYAEADAEGSALEVALDIARATLAELAERSNWLLWLDLASVLPPWETPREFVEPYFEEGGDEDEEDREDGDEEREDGEEEEVEETEESEDVNEEAAPLTPLAQPPKGPIDPADDELFFRIQSTCAGAVSWLDAAVEQLRDALREAGVEREMLIIVTSDVGLPLGEHGIVGSEQAPLQEEVIHVPLIVRLPEAAEAGRRVAALTQAVDLAPTLAEAFGAALPGSDGQSLWPLMRGQIEKVRDHAIAMARHGNEAQWCLRTPEWAFLLPASRTDGEQQARLYVKPDDRWEVNDVRQHHVERAEEFERLLREAIEKYSR
jgi:arylsulfatase A-like enzyme